ncbi:MAG: hypothetical protein SFW08_04790 [Gemmatimonadaceae bacterium]|nr:hypothetical protein [Gemmatimonadaceae bacterium]
MPSLAPYAPRTTRPLLAVLGLLAVGSGCTDLPTAPRAGAAQLQLGAVVTEPLTLQGFPSLRATAVRVRVRRGQALLRDTTAAFPSTTDTLRLELTVPAAIGEQLTADLRVLADSVLVLEGSAAVTARAAGDAPVDVIPVSYRGPGFDATTLAVAPRSGLIEVTDSVVVAAGATNAQQQPVPQVLIAWSSSDTTIATVSTTGRVRARANGDAWIVARTPNGLRDSSRIRVVGAAQLVAQGATVGIAPSSTALASPFAVVLRDGAARPIAGSRVAWQLTGDGTFANGLSVDTTVTDSAGVARVTASTGASGATSQVSARSVQFRAPTPVGFVVVTQLPNITRIFVGNDATTNWSAPNNWAPAGVPTAADSVLVPLLPGPRTPTLTSAVTVASVQIGPGAAVSIGAFDLTVTARWSARGASVAATTGRVVSSGAAVSVAGALPGLLVAGGRATVVDTVATTGDVTVSAGTLAVGPAPLAVGGQLLVIDNGYVEQLVASSRITVQGNAEFRGGVAGTGLANGVLEVGGNFTVQNANNGDTRTFPAAVTHTVRLVGGAAQSVSLQSPGPGQLQVLGSLLIDKSGGTVAFASPLEIRRHFRVLSATTVTSTGTLSVQDSLSTVLGSDLSGVPLVSLFGAGTSFPVVRGTPPAVLDLLNSRAVASNESYAGNVRVRSGTLTVSAATLSIGGTFDVRDDGLLAQPDAGSVVRVSGNTFFRGSPGGLGLVNGVLDVGGNFTVQNANNGDTRTFPAAAAHTLRLSGGAAQTVSLQSPGPGLLQVLGSLLIDKSGGNVAVTSAVEIRRHFRVLSATPVTASATISVTDSMSTVIGSDLSGVPLVALVGTGTTFPSVRGFRPDTLDLYSSRTVSSNESFDGTLRVRSGTLTVTNATLFVGGDLDIRDDGQLAQPDAGSVVRCSQTVFFRGAPGALGLVAGRLEVGGNFTVQNANNGDTRTFDAGSAHTVRLYSGGAQTVSFASPGISLRQTFGSLVIDKTDRPVTFATNAQMRRHFTVRSPTVVAAAGTISVTDSLATAVGSDLSAVARIELIGSGTTFPVVRGQAPALLDIYTARSVAANETYPGTIRIRDGITTVSGATLTIGGALSVIDNGYIAQPDAASAIAVAGDVTLRGGVGGSLLANGRIDVGGNFQVFNANNGDTRTFIPAAGHTVRLLGAGDQTITLQSPGDGLQQQFTNLIIEKPSGQVTLGSAVRALGDLLVRTPTIVGGGQPLTVSDSVSTVAGSSLAGLAVLSLVGTSTTFPDVAGAPPPFLDVNNARTVSTAADYPGAVRVRNGTLTIGATTAIIRGALSVIDNGYVAQSDPLSLLDVRGNVLFSGGVVQSGMTAGELRVGGNFASTNAGNGDARTFVPSGTHVTAMVGSSAATISMVSPVTGSQQFRNLRIANPAGVTALTPVLATGALSGTGLLNTGGFAIAVSSCALSRSVISGVLGGLATACPP